MRNIRAVGFDVYNTLIDIVVDEEAIETYAFLSRWLSYHGVQIQAVDLRARYLELCHKEMSRNFESHPDIDIGRVFAKLMLNGSHQPDSDAQERAGEMALLFRMLTTRSISVSPGVLSMLEALKGKVTLGILSNSQRLFTIPELTRFGLIGYFDSIHFSSDVGACKPNGKMFRDFLTAAAVPPEQTVFVGDHPVADILAAKKSAMQTILLKRQCWTETLKLNGATHPDYEVEGADYQAVTEILLSLLG